MREQHLLPTFGFAMQGLLYRSDQGTTRFCGGVLIKDVMMCDCGDQVGPRNTERRKAECEVKSLGSLFLMQIN